VNIKEYSLDFAGKKLEVEVGKLAGQANGSCRVQYGETTVLITATMSNQPKDSDYFPLSVEYEEKYYAAGKIKGSKWIKRETRPSEEAILTGRLIDRSLRPRFDQNIRNEIQIVPTVLTFDGVNDPDIPALFGASLALMISDIPFDGPVAGVRVGRVNGDLVINPSYKERLESDLDIVVSGTAEKINMIEAGAKIVGEDGIVNAVEKGFGEVKKLIEFQREIAADLKPKKKELNFFSHDENLVKVVGDFVSPKLQKVLYTPHKLEYVEGIKRTMDEMLLMLEKEYNGHPDLDKKKKEAKVIFEEQIDKIVHKNIIEGGKRPDGRKTDELREIGSEISLLPHCHGSGLFNRGTTQALSILTLAAPGMEQWVETMEIELTKKRFMHHYVFPPFSVGETGRLGFTGRREIGHGALAERALEPLIPVKDQFPYTIRVVSEILSSNGSSSMASVSGSTLALMDGGVPIKAPAAGIAMGLMFDEAGEEYKILTDIQGPEDHHGDMDLKVAGTKDGITAMQMDVKIEGITPKILSEALKQSKKARLEILAKMAEVIKEPKANVSQYAPKIKIIKINPEKIGSVIGPQGKVINNIIDKTGVAIDIDDDGTVFVTSSGADGLDEALKMINTITFEAKSGDEFDGKVSRILDFGAMVEYLPGKEGLVHISEISNERVKRVSDVLKIGQQVHVRVKNIDDYGRINLTMKNGS
jgi:polyribonucleotide nucleotidyltransferase